MAKAPSSSRPIVYIMLALLVWGGLLAGGAYLYGGTRHGLKAGFIFGCVLAFLAFWAVLLKYRASAHGADED